ncbi:MULTISPECIES: hypothetical protein [unclassified Nocardia]|uniref:hypothetical protein n=1 Tax=unclassified Nocardia TaxID=2637762 RepID=UPI00135C0315|nr:hypothetical protein [Nocardia sp. CY41]
MASEDLQARVAALEAQVRDLTGRLHIAEQDAAAARVLAGGADRDVTAICSEIRDFRQATLAEFTAVHEDLTDLRTSMNSQFTELHNGFAEIQGKLAAAASGQSRILTMLTMLIERGNGQQPRL